jgi:folylpolyglutamate synthase
MDKSYKVALDIDFLFAMSNLKQRAIDLLNRRRRPQRPSIEPAKGFPGLSRMPSFNGQSDLRGTPSIFGMRQWLDELGHSVLEAYIQV